MALTFIGNISSISADLSTGILSDITTYGGANSARNTLALFLVFVKRDANSNDTAIIIDNSTPLTVNQYSFSLPSQDGLFVGNMFAFNIWSAGTYTLNQCVYYTPTNSYYIVNAATTTQTPGGSNWTLITNVQATATGNASVQQGQFYAWSAAVVSSGALGDAMSDLAIRMVQGKCKNWDDAAQVLTGAALVEGAFLNFRRLNYVSAQQIIDYADAQISTSI